MDPQGVRQSVVTRLNIDGQRATATVCGNHGGTQRRLRADRDLLAKQAKREHH